MRANTHRLSRRRRLGSFQCFIEQVKNGATGRTANRRRAALWSDGRRAGLQQQEEGGYCFLSFYLRGGEMGGETQTGEDGCGRLCGRGARSEPRGPSVSSYLGQSDTHCMELLCRIGSTGQRKQPDGGMHRRLSVRLREGAAAARCGWPRRRFYRTNALIICTHG